MAEIPVGEFHTADRDAFFRDTGDGLVYRRVRDSLLASIGEDILIALGSGGNGFHSSVSVPTTPGSVQVLQSVTVPLNTIRELSMVTVVCRQEGEAYIYVDGDLVGSMRTGAASPNATYRFIPRKIATTGQVIEVSFTARPGAPISTVDCHIQAIDKST